MTDVADDSDARSAADRADRASEVLDRLRTAYPDAAISLQYSTRFELLVAVILSAQCTDERVNAVTADLFDTYDGPADYATADETQLAEDIYGITFHNNKASYLNGAARRILEEHDGQVPDTMADLTALPGVGRKTANVVLQHGHDVVEGIVVDTHVQRLTRRLGLTDAHDPEAIERELMSLFPEAAWRDLTHLLIAHGRATCTARSPTCTDCTLEDVCPSSRRRADRDLASGEPWPESG